MSIDSLTITDNRKGKAVRSSESLDSEEYRQSAADSSANSAHNRERKRTDSFGHSHC